MDVGILNATFNSHLVVIEVEFITSVSKEVSLILTIIGLTLFPISYVSPHIWHN